MWKKSTHSGACKISRGVVRQPQRGMCQSIIWQFFVVNCMKTKEIGVGRKSLPSPLLAGSVEEDLMLQICEAIAMDVQSSDCKKECQKECQTK